MEVTDNSFEFTGGSINPWQTGVYSPKVTVVETSDDKTDEDTEDNDLLDLNQEPITEKVIADLSDENDGDDEETPSENIHAIITAKKLKEEGWLNVEELPEDIDYPQIYELFKDSARERLLQEVQTEVEQQLASAGINEQNLSILSALENGIPLDEVSQVSRFKKYITLKSDDQPEDKKMAVIRERYMSIGLKEKDLERQLTAIEQSGEIDEAFEESQQFFKGVVSEFDKSQILMAQQLRERDLEIKRKNQEILDKAVRQGELGNQKLTAEEQKDLHKSIIDRSVVREIDGTKYSFSPFEEFLYLMNNDFEFQLLQFKNYKFKGKADVIDKVKRAESANKDDWDAVRKAQEADKQKKSLKRGNTVDKVEPSQRGFTIEIPRYQ